MKDVVTISVAAALVLSAGLTAAPPPAAPAATAPAVETEVGAGPWELRRSLAQVIAGASLAAVGGLVIAGAADRVPPPLVFFGTPAAVGLTVCAVGKGGAHEGPCAASVLGAYLGALSVFPLAYLGNRLDDDNPFGAAYSEGTALGFMVGWLLVQPVLSTVAWRIFAHPRPRPARPAGRTASRPLAPERALLTPLRRLAAGPQALVVPLLQTSF